MPLLPQCIENDLGIQDTSNCSYCNVGYKQICDNLPGNVTILEGDSLCFNKNNLNVLQAFIDSSDSTLNIDTMDIDSSGVIEPLELGIQSWGNSDLISLRASNLELSGSIPDSIGNLSNLETLHLHENNLDGLMPDGICKLTNLNPGWASDSTTESNSYIYNNALCPPYPYCIESNMGEQDCPE